MDYFGIVRRAFKIALKHKFLWIFGILAGGAAGTNGFNFSLPSSNFSNSEWSKFTNSTGNFDWSAFWSSYGGIILALMAIFAIISIVFFILNIISQGALVGSVEKIESGEKSDFYHGFHLGSKQFWRVWGMGVIFLLMILASLIVLIVPVTALVILGQYIVAAILGVLLLVVCLAFWVLMGVISPYSLRIVVLKKLPVFESIRASLHLVRDNLGEVIVMYLLLIAIGMGVGLVSVLAIMLAGGILLVIGFGIWSLSQVAAIICGLIFALILFIALIVFSGAYSSFYSSVITLTYLKIAHK